MSVKTGAVGSNPRIEKLMDVSVDNLRIYAATTLTEQILLRMQKTAGVRYVK